MPKIHSVYSIQFTTRKRSANWKLHLNGQEVRIADKLKYLGVIIDKKITWKEHIKYLDQKISAMVDRVRRFSWMRFDLDWKYKRRLYYSVFLPTITYASAAWFDDIERRKGCLENLRRVQRRFVLAASGAYRCTANSPLMKLLGLTDVIEELRVLAEATGRSGKDKKALKFSRRVEEAERTAGFEIAAPNFDVDRINNKHVIWCVSDCGPFKRLLLKIGKTTDDWCRYCNAATETASHLLYDCEALAIKLNENSSMDEINRKCTDLVRKLQADAWRI